MSRIITSAPCEAESERVLSPRALDFVAALHSEFETELRAVLHARQVSRSGSDVGRLPAAGQPVDSVWKSDDFTVVGAGCDIGDSADGFVEVAAPALGEQISGALRSGAQLWTADFHTGLSPRWKNVITAQNNLVAAVRGEALAVDPHSGHRVNIRTGQMPLISIRPRDLHTRESHLVWESDSGRRMQAIAGLVDFGLFFFHNAARLELLEQHVRVHLPGIETAAEAKLWNDVFDFAQTYRGFDRGFIRATVQVDTFGGASYLEDILFALRHHCEAVTTGVRSYMSSLISAARDYSEISFEDWTTLDFDEPSVTALLDRTAALAAQHGAVFSAEYDSTRPEMTRVRVGDPALTDTARELLSSASSEAAAESAPPTEDPGRSALIVGARTPHIGIENVQANIRRVLRFTDAYLSGIGEYREGGRMIGGAAAQLSHSQLWQWMRNGIELVDGRTLDRDVFQRALAEELAVVPLHAADFYDEVADALTETVTSPDFTENFIGLTCRRAFEHRRAA